MLEFLGELFGEILFSFLSLRSFLVLAVAVATGYFVHGIFPDSSMPFMFSIPTGVVVFSIGYWVFCHGVSDD